MSNSFLLTHDDIDSLYPVYSILQECGATNLTDSGAYYTFSSPFREDKNPSMILYKNSMFARDFGGGFAGSIFVLVRQALGISLFKLIGHNPSEFLSKKFFAEQKEEKTVDRIKSPESFSLEHYEGSIEYNWDANPLAQEYANERFMSLEFLQAFEIGYTRHCRFYRALRDSERTTHLKGTLYQDRICIPIYYQNNLVSIEGRDYTKVQTPKVLYPKGGLTSFLFNQDNLDFDKPLVVVEGIMDLVRIWIHITKNVTTTFGVTITPNQKKILKECKHLILFPDSDDGGRRMISSVEEFMEEPYWIAQLEKGDPGDPSNSVDDIRYAIENAVESTQFFLDESELFVETEITASSFFSL